MVAAGTLDALAAFAARPPARARVIALQVAGAFHTEHMAPAVAELRAAADDVTPGEPLVPLLTNSDGTVTASGARALELIVAQVANPVRWDLCQATLPQLGVTGLLEVAPGGVLTGLARRTLPGVETVAVKTPADLDAARDLVRRHAGTPAEPPGEVVVTRPTLTQATGPAHTRILGLGGVRGERVVPNDDLVGPIDSSDEWIRQRTGIVTRRRAEAGTDVLDLAEGAARAALENAGLTGADIDVVILSTVTYFHQTPAGAAIIADRIGATPAAAFDISAACAGLLLRHRPGRRARPRGHRAQRAGHRRREDERASSTRPTAPSRSCSATAPARSSSARPTRPASARPSGAPTAARRRRSARRTRGSPRATRASAGPRCARRARASSSGPSGRWRPSRRRRWTPRA